MPPHHMVFQHVDDFTFQPPLVVAGATRACLVDGKGLQLRRMSQDETEFNPAGQYLESWVEFPNWQASGLESLYGFRTNEVLSGQTGPTSYGGSVGYQLSNDGGGTWLYHDGTSWTAAGFNNWSSWSLVDEYLPDFPLTADKQIRLRVRLTPSANGYSTPYLNGVTVYADLEYDFQDDLLRSMKRWLERHVWVDAQYFEQVPQSTSGGTGCTYGGPSDTVIFSDKKWEEFSEPASVYNLTTDPGRSTNLFAGFVPGGVQMTSPQEGLIESNFKARPPVYIAAEEFIQLSSIPSVVVQLASVKERRDLRWGNDEVDFALMRRRAKRHVHRVWFDAEFRISCQSDLRAEMIRMSDSVNRALTHHQFVLSLSTGETMPVPYATPINPTDRIAQGLYVREYACTLFGKAWLRPELTVERYLAEKLRFYLTPTTVPIEKPGYYYETTEVTP